MIGFVLPREMLYVFLLTMSYAKGFQWKITLVCLKLCEVISFGSVRWENGLPESCLELLRLMCDLLDSFEVMSNHFCLK